MAESIKRWRALALDPTPVRAALWAVVQTIGMLIPGGVLLLIAIRRDASLEHFIGVGIVTLLVAVPWLVRPWRLRVVEPPTDAGPVLTTAGLITRSVLSPWSGFFIAVVVAAAFWPPMAGVGGALVATAALGAWRTGALMRLERQRRGSVLVSWYGGRQSDDVVWFAPRG